MLQLWWIWRWHGFQQKCQGIRSWYFIRGFLLKPRWLRRFWCQFTNANYWPNVCSCFCLQVSEKIAKWINPRTAPCDLTEKRTHIARCIFWCHFANANYWPIVCPCFCLQVHEKIVKWLNLRIAPCDLTEKKTHIAMFFLLSFRECKLLAECVPVHFFISGYWVFLQNQLRNLSNDQSALCDLTWNGILFPKLF